MGPSAGLRTALNKMREMSVRDNSIYHQYIPVVTDSTTIGEFGTPILNASDTSVLNDFVGLLRKVVMTAVEQKLFNNPLQQLEGEKMPLGQFIEDVYINPAKARQFNVNDFAGLLQKYEAEVAVQYFGVNSDLQYQVTITRDKIRNAFTSWAALESLIAGYINSLYNGAYIDRYSHTKGLITAAYKANKARVKVIADPVDEATAKALIKTIRADLNKMKVPSVNYNAWNQVKGDGLKLKTWVAPEDTILFITADVDATASVDVLAKAFNMSETDFLANKVIVVDDFNIYDESGNLAVDGSAIKAMLCDKAWFKIKTQDFAMEDFRNPNNRSFQYYLNDVRMYNYSVFANAMIYATAAPEVPATAINFGTEVVEIEAGDKEGLDITSTPVNATTAITYAVTTGQAADLTLTATENGRHLLIEASEEAAGDYTITGTAGSVTATLTVRIA